MNYINQVTDLLPEANRTVPVINFLLHTAITMGIGVHNDKLPSSLEQLQADIRKSYETPRGATPATVLNYIRDHRDWPQKGTTSVTLERYQSYEHSGSMNALEYGLVEGFFLLAEDSNTVQLHPQVEELFFPPITR